MKRVNPGTEAQKIDMLISYASGKCDEAEQTAKQIYRGRDTWRGLLGWVKLTSGDMTAHNWSEIRITLKRLLDEGALSLERAGILRARAEKLHRDALECEAAAWWAAVDLDSLSLQRSELVQ